MCGVRLALLIESTMESVYVMGGTHGNECSGVVAARRIQREAKQLSSKHSTNVQVLLSNTDAIEAVTRYVGMRAGPAIETPWGIVNVVADTDLNRCFTLEGLAKPPSNREERRAREVRSTRD